MSYKVAVVGATGSVGREILSVLAERGFSASDVTALGAGEGAGREVSFGEDDVLRVGNAETFDFSGTDVVILAAGAKAAAHLAPKAAEAGCAVVDTSPHFRMEPGVPLVVPAVNRNTLDGWRKRRIVACPGPLTAQIALALAPLHETFGVARVVASTYQSTAGAGRAGMDELFHQTRGIYVNEPPSSSQEVFTKQIAFNVIPHVEAFMDDGATREEWGMAVETRKLLAPDIRVHANCCRVPVFVGAAAFLNVETEVAISAEKARAILKEAEGVTVIDHRVDEGYVTPVECAGEDSVYVSRIRADASVDNGVSFWVVGDDLRAGAACVAVDVVQALIAEGL